MRHLFSQIRHPVKRHGSEIYLLITLLSFAASVILTRLFLELTGYPQVGSSGLHIAHVLWGGLLLFIASLLPLMFANRWVYIAGGLLSGIGVGLFIDEVGKFITRTNDYFYPAAAPIIYAFFLLTVLLYLRIRRPSTRSSRIELYQALDGLEEVLEHDLDPQERADLEATLRDVVRDAEHPEWARLAQALLDFLMSDVVELRADVPTVWERYAPRVRAFEARYVTRRRLKLLLVAGLLMLGWPALLAPVAAAMAAFSPGDVWARIIGLVAAVGQVPNVPEARSLVTRLLLEFVAGLPLLVAAAFLLAGRERVGMFIAYFGLLLSLTVINLLIFYFDQFSAMARAMAQFGLLLACIYYRRNYLMRKPGVPPAGIRAG